MDDGLAVAERGEARVGGADLVSHEEVKLPRLARFVRLERKRQAAPVGLREQRADTGVRQVRGGSGRRRRRDRRRSASQ